MEEKKNNKLWLGIFIGVLITLVIGLSFFIIYDKVLLKNDNQMKQNNENIDNNETEQILDNNESQQENVDKEEEYLDFDISKFDETKPAINGTNGTKGWAYHPADNYGDSSGLSIRINDDKRSAVVTIDWSKYSKIYGISATTSEIKEYNISNFTKNIKETYIGGFGQDSGRETAFYIMEDGTVEYTPIKHALSNNDSSSETILKSYGKLDNVFDVVKIITAIDYCPDDSTYLGGAYNILGIKANGSFYNLSTILYQSAYYSFY